MKNLLLAFPLVLSACVALSSNSGQGAGFGSYSAVGNDVAKAAPQYAPAATNRAEIKRAAQSAFGRGLPRDDVTVPVAGVTMRMRIVEARGYTFAVLQERGIPFALKRAPDLSEQVQKVAQMKSGCAISGDTWKMQFSNGAHPKYAVHLICR